MEHNKNMGKILIAAGIVLVIAGLIFHFGKGLPLGRLPGDIHIKKDNFSFYFPLTTGILLSIILSLILFLVSKFR